jgi:hypothetical protein
VLAPVPLVAAMLLLAGWAGARYRPSGLLFGAAAVLITIAPPYAYVLYGVHRGRLTTAISATAASASPRCC